MSIKYLGIINCWTYEPTIFKDGRGSFFEWFQEETFEKETGYSFRIAQANASVSKKGTLRGIHYANFPPGQAKYVTCLSGSVFDVVVDLRKGSPTFGKWDSVILDSKRPMALYIPSGIGHAFMALEDNSTFVYMCDERYNPLNEFEINPFDPDINITWPHGIKAELSEKDKDAPNYLDVLDSLPRMVDLA